MPCQHDRVLAVRQHIFDIFLKRPSRNGHGLAGEVMQTLPAYRGSRDSSSAWHVEREVVGARLQVSINVAASERRVGISNGLFKRVQEASAAEKADGTGNARTYK